MNPQDNAQNPRIRSSSYPQEGRGVAPASRVAQQHQAAADIIRNQLETIYQGGSGEPTPQTTPVVVSNVVTPESPNSAKTVTTKPAGHGLKTAPPTEPEEPEISHDLQNPDQTQPVSQPELITSPYQRTMQVTYTADVPDTDHRWQQYHEAWQKYYQLYYERHYLNHIQAQRQSAQVAVSKPQIPVQTEANDTLSSKEAMAELRQTIRQKVVDSAQKVKKSRHFTPVLAGLVVLIAVAFLQWNSMLFGYIAAYASPGNADPQNIIPNAAIDVDVGPEPRMIIPKINLDGAVVYGIGPDYNSQMTAMESGIAHFSIPGANAVPGQVGNAVFAAHSSNDVFARGDQKYKQIFARNERLVEGDVIYMHFESKRYVYSVTRTEVVMPDEVSRIQIETDKPMLTLISCVPLGTAQKRLLVFAEQVSPDPSKAATATEDTAQASNTTIPGRSAPTLIERLFGAE